MPKKTTAEPKAKTGDLERRWAAINKNGWVRVFPPKIVKKEALRSLRSSIQFPSYSDWRLERVEIRIPAVRG